MKNRLAAAFVPFLIVFGFSPARAQVDATWNKTANNLLWETATNWTPATVPNGVGDIARITANITAGRTISNNQAVTLGGLVVGDSAATVYTYTLLGNGSFAFDNGANPAWILQTAGNNVINLPMQLNSDLYITNNNAGQALRLLGAISGDKTITLFPGGPVKFENSATSFSGGITNYVELRTLATASLGSGPIVMMGGSGMGADNAGYAFSNNFSVLGDFYLGYNASAFTLYGDMDLNGATRALTATGVATVAGAVLNGGLSVYGPRTLVLNGANTFADGLVVAGGATLAGSGSVASATTVDGALAPGTDGSFGTFTVSNNLTTGWGGTNRFDIGVSTTPGGGTNDLVEVTGDLWLGGTLAVSPSGGAEGLYRLFNYGGTLLGSYDTVTMVNARMSGTVVTSTVGQVDLQVVNFGTNLVWTGTGSRNWNLNSSANWDNGSGADVFLAGDSAYFDDNSATQDVQMTSVLFPRAVVFNNTLSNYTVTASGGRLSGSTGLVKDGPGVLTIGGANDYTGDVIVSNGTLKANANGTFGSIVGSTYVLPGATLDVGGNRDFGAEHFYVVGSGVGGTGVVVNTGASGQSQLEYVTLTGDSVFGGPVRFDLRDGGAGAALDGLYTLTKMGGSQVSIVSATVNIGRVEIQQGTLSFEGSATVNTGYDIHVHEGATLMSWSLQEPMGRDIFATNAILLVSGGSTSITNNRLSGAVAIEGLVTNNTAANVYMSLLGTVSGGGTYVKIGAGSSILGGANGYTGGTIVQAGTLMVGDDGALGPGALTMNGGALAPLDAGARVIANPLLVGGNFGLGLAGAGDLTLTSGADLGGSARTITVTGSRAILSGVLANGGLTKAGTGTLVLPGANPYDLGTTLSAGTLAAGNDGALGAGPITLSGGRLSSDGGAARAFANTITITAASSLGDPVNTGALTLSGTVDFGGASRNLTVDSDVRIAGTSANGGVNQKLGVGTLTIAADGDWTKGGALEIRGGDVVFDGATVTNADAFRIMSVIAGGLSRLVVTNGAVLVCTNVGANLRIGYESSNNRTATNVVEVAGTMVLNGAGAAGNTQLGSDSTNSILNLYTGGSLFTASINDNGADAGFAGAERTVNFRGGALVALRDAATDFINLDLATAANHVYVHEGGAIIDSQGYTIGIPMALENGTGGADGGLVKRGAGTLTLSGTNTYNGTTTVEAGTLALGAAGSVAASALIDVRTGAVFDVTAVPGGFNLGTGQTLMGNGTVNGAVTADGTVSPGASAGELTVGVYTQSASGTLAIELGGTTPVGGYDRLAVLGGAELGGTLTVTLSGGFTPVAGNTFALLTAASVSGVFTTTSLPPISGATWVLTNTGNALVLTALSTSPEPYDLWAVPYGLAPGGGAGDADGDGSSDLFEYSQLSNPTNSASRGLPGGSQTGGVLRLVFNRNAGATDITYIVEAASAVTNGAAWVNVNSNYHGTGWSVPSRATETGAGDARTVTVSDAVTAATNRFMRLRVTKP